MVPKRWIFKTAAAAAASAAGAAVVPCVSPTLRDMRALGLTPCPPPATPQEEEKQASCARAVCVCWWPSLPGSFSPDTTTHADTAVAASSTAAAAKVKRQRQEGGGGGGVYGMASYRGSSVTPTTIPRKKLVPDIVAHFFSSKIKQSLFSGFKKSNQKGNQKSTKTHNQPWGIFGHHSSYFLTIFIFLWHRETGFGTLSRNKTVVCCN